MFFRTDMAVERRDLYRNANKIENEIKGVECEEEKNDDIKVTRVRITDKEGEKALDRKMGDYITIDMKRVNNITTEKEEKIIDTFSKELKNIIEKNSKPRRRSFNCRTWKPLCNSRFIRCKSGTKYRNNKTYKNIFT